MGRAAVIRVLLADDQPLVRAGFAMILGAEEDMTVVGEADDGAAAVALAAAARPDVVLMDIRMPGMDGLAATRQIAADEALATVKILVLTTFELDEYVFEALRCGTICGSLSTTALTGTAAVPTAEELEWLRRRTY